MQPILNKYPSSLPDPEPPGKPILCHPKYFVADIDGSNFVVDTGANWFIVNDPGLLSNIQKVSGRVKGIRSAATAITGVGELNLQLSWDHKTSSTIKLPRAVIVLSCPYNLLLPQLLLSELRDQRFKIEKSVHDDSTYQFRIQTQESKVVKMLTTTASQNGLFFFCTTSSYNSFFAEAHHYNFHWKNYAEAATLIPQNGDSDFSNNDI